MPVGVWSAKDERQYEAILDSCRSSGRDRSDCERMAAATVNKRRAEEGRTAMKGLAGGGATRRKGARRKPRTVEALKRARRRFCAAKAPGMTCDLEQGSFLRDGAIKIFRQRILSDAVFPSTVTRGPKSKCTFYVTYDEPIADGLPPYSEYGAHTSRGRWTMWSYCDGRVEGDMGHTSKEAAVEKAKRASSFDPQAYFRRKKRREKRARKKKRG